MELSRLPDRRKRKMKDEVITVMVLRAGEFMAEVKTIPNELNARACRRWIF